MMPPGALEYRKNAEMMPPAALEYRKNAEMMPVTVSGRPGTLVAETVCVARFLVSGSLLRNDVFKLKFCSK